MRPFALLVLGLALAASAAAEETKSTADYYNKAMKSDTTKNLKSQALAKVGADVTTSPAGAKAYFIEPKNGAEVKGAFKAVFGLSGMGVAPAGAQNENTGHFHLLVDEPQVDLLAPLPKSPQVIHYGGGQTEATVTLKPGKHTLQIVLADWKHQAHNPAVQSEKITITVK
ncbi:MAG TPA: DUF4399 domain-containing protein [Candidatus Binatia bacterium]|nr:DUF4399 domain-containing protein [Candidatus Binatia bacterium]